MFKGFLLVLCLGCLSLTAQADDFSVKDRTGKVHRLAEYRGKWVLVNFWATWCPGCVKEMSDLSALHQAHKDKDLVVIGLNMDTDPELVDAFLKNNPVSFPVVMDYTKAAAEVAPVDALPTTYLYNPQGKMAARNVGPVTRKVVEQFIAKQK